MCFNCAQTGYAVAESVGLDQSTTKMISIATAAVMLFSLAAPLVAPTQAVPAKTVKAGAVCTKANAKTTISGKTFVCKKSGKKLVWRVQAKKTKPTESVNTAPSNPTTPTNPVTPPKKLTRLEKIYQQLNADTSQLRQADLRIKTILSPKVNPNRAAEIHAKYEQSLQYQGKGITKPVTMVFFDETEQDWYSKKAAELEGPKPNYFWPDANKCPRNPGQICGWGFANATEQIYYHIVGSSSVWQNWHQHVVDHEVVHMWQGVFTPQFNVLCWIIEGQANGLGYALSHAKTPNSVNQERAMQITRLAGPYPNYKSFTKADWVRTVTEIDQNSNRCPSAIGYSFGMLVFEAMYEKYGYQKVTNFTISLSKTRSLQQATSENFGGTVTELYELIAEYVVEAIKAAN
jgi:hypothetical protein